MKNNYLNKFFSLITSKKFKTVVDKIILIIWYKNNLYERKNRQAAQNSKKHLQAEANVKRRQDKNLKRRFKSLKNKECLDNLKSKGIEINIKE